MPRVARIVLPGLPHHVTQRGNNRQDVFFARDDRRLYLEILNEEARRHGVAVLGYCLMTNHVHLILVPDTEQSLAKTLGRVHFRYAQRINLLHGRTGHLWQARFFSCPLDAKHLPRAMRYVERNPVRARLARKPWTYPWSSARAHVESDDPSGLLDARAWRRRFSAREWREYLDAKDDPDFVFRLRNNTSRGRPLAGDAFMAKLEKKLNRRLRPLPVGRPRKPKSSNA
ncbi:MAG: transposase [Deltaproteobacteria bacterium]|nr:transposase [Deltaproteobacteria bacterium]